MKPVHIINPVHLDERRKQVFELLVCAMEALINGNAVHVALAVTCENPLDDFSICSGLPEGTRRSVARIEKMLADTKANAGQGVN